MKKVEKKIPSWLKLTPPELQGGPAHRKRMAEQMQREQQQKPHGEAMLVIIAAEPHAPVQNKKESLNKKGKIEKKTGETIHTPEFRTRVQALLKTGMPSGQAYGIANKQLGYANSVLPSHQRRQLPKGYKKGGVTGTPSGDIDTLGGYTGDGGKFVNPDKEVNEKTFVDHEGEYYVNAPVVNAIGGPNRVKSLMAHEANKAIERAGVNMGVRSGVKPVVGPGEPMPPLMGRSDAPDEYKQGGEVSKSGKIGFAPGGIVATKITNPGHDLNSGIMGGNNSVEDSGFNTNAPTNPVTDAGFSKTVSNPVQDAGFNTPSSTTNNNTINPLTPQAPVTTAPTTTAPNSRGSSLDTHTAGRGIVQASTVESKSTNPTPTPSPAAPVSSTVSTTTPPPATSSSTTTSATNPTSIATDNANINATLGTLQQTAQGKGQLITDMINQTMQQYGINTATGQNDLQMKLAANGITGAAAQAALSQYQENARIGQQQTMGNLNQQILTAAQGANTQLQNAYNTQRTYDTNQGTAAMQAALNAGDYKTYGNLVQQNLGVTIDTSTLQNAATAAASNAAYADLGTKYAAFGDKLSTDDHAVMSDLTALWKQTTAGANGAQMTTDFANTTLQNYKNAANPLNQLADAYTEADATSLFFNGKSDDMAQFKYQNLVGYPAFQQALKSLYGNGISKNSDGTFTPDFSNPLLRKLFPDTVTQSAQKPTDGWQIGGTYTDGSGKNYTITAVDSKTGALTMKSGTTNYTATQDSSGNIVGTQVNIPVGSAISTKDITFTNAPVGTVTAVGTSAMGTISKDGAGTLSYIDGTTDTATTIDKTNFNQVLAATTDQKSRDAMINAYAAQAANDQTSANKATGSDSSFSQYLSTLGYTTPDTEVLNAFVAKGDVAAVNYEISKMASNGTFSIDKTPALADYASKNSTSIGTASTMTNNGRVIYTDSSNFGKVGFVNIPVSSQIDQDNSASNGAIMGTIGTTKTFYLTGNSAGGRISIPSSSDWLYPEEAIASDGTKTTIYVRHG